MRRYGCSLLCRLASEESRWRDYLTFMPNRPDQPMQAVYSWTGLVAEMNTVKLCSNPLDNVAHAGVRCIDLTPKADLSLLAGLGDGNRVL